MFESNVTTHLNRTNFKNRITHMYSVTQRKS